MTQAASTRSVNDLSEQAVVGGFLGYQQSADSQLHQAREAAVQLGFGRGFEHLEPEPERVRRFIHLLDHDFGTRIGRIYKKADDGRFGVKVRAGTRAASARE